LRIFISPCCIAAWCPCPSWFANDSAAIGSHDWPSGQDDPPVCAFVDEEFGNSVPYRTQVSYVCPDGYVFETPDLLLYDERSSVLTMTCLETASWTPKVIPKCIREWKIRASKRLIFEFGLFPSWNSNALQSRNASFKDDREKFR